MQDLDIIGEGEYFVMSSYLKHVQHHLQEFGISPAQLLENTGLGAEVLAQHNLRLGHESVATANLNACKAVPSESALIKDIATRRTPSSHGTMGMAALLSSDVHTALTIVHKYIKTRYSGINSQLDIQEKAISMQLDVPDSIMEFDRLTVLSTFLVLDTFMRTMIETNTSDCTTEISIQYPMPDDWEVDDFPQVNFLFNQPLNKITMPGYLLYKKVKFADQQQYDSLTSDCDKELKTVQKDNSLNKRLSDLLANSELPLPDLQSAADRLHLSARSLRRKLNDEGESYSTIKANELNNRAINLLQHSQYNMQKITALLSYSDYKSFSRAFSKINQVSPSVYRKTLTAQKS